AIADGRKAALTQWQDLAGPHATRHGALAVAGLGEQVHQVELQAIGVLKLVDQQRANALLDLPTHHSIIAQQIVRAANQIDEVEHWQRLLLGRRRARDSVGQRDDAPGELLLLEAGHAVLHELPRGREWLPFATRTLGQRALAAPLTRDADQRRIPARDGLGLAVADAAALDRERAQGRLQAVFLGLLEQLDADTKLHARGRQLGLGLRAIEARLRAAVCVAQQ